GTSFERALQAVTDRPEDGDTRGLAIEIRLAVERPLTSLGEHRRCLALLGEAEALARRLDDRSWLGRVLARMASGLRTIGDHDGAMVAGQRGHEPPAQPGGGPVRAPASH